MNATDGANEKFVYADVRRSQSGALFKHATADVQPPAGPVQPLRERL
jgi:hypothetical protein